jgi:Uma2 family endonuclease
MPTTAARPKKRRVIREPELRFETMQEVLDYLGGISPERVHMQPWPGTATQADLLNPRNRGLNGALELVDGILVEKAPMGLFQSVMAIVLAGKLRVYLEDNNLGLVSAGRDGYIKLKRGRVRVPDVAFVAWNRIPEGRTPHEPCPALIADLVVEVLSRGNRRKEMARKRREFFERGTKLFWIVDPKRKVVTVYQSSDDGHDLGLDDFVDGEDVLPGFRLSIRNWFELAETGNSPAPRPKKS